MTTSTVARRTLTRSAYNLVEFPLAVLRFVVLLPLAVFGIATLIIGIGVPVLAFALGLAGGFATLDRARLAVVQGRPVAVPSYKKTEKTGFMRFWATISDPQRWLDLAHGVFGLIPAIIAFVLTFTWWTVMIAALTSVFWVWAIPESGTDLADLLGFTTYAAEVIVNLGVGLVFLVTLPAMMRVTAALPESLARVMLTTDRLAVLQGQVTELAESRDAAVSAETTALRRLERDIHDGPQQRLVRLAMDLSTAQRRLDKDPEAAKPLLEEAIAQTRETLDELRALSRGIAPPILVDRGLMAALAALAGRSTVPVDLHVDLLPDTRLPEKAENAAYFVVAEALTNVAKHSGASHCTVNVERTGASVRVLVTDDGMGGAHPAKGHGLSGLMDRVRAIGGTLDVESPVGGPTIVSADLPS